MKKINIVKSTRDFERILNQNKTRRNKYFNLYFSKNNLDIYRIGISVPKKVGNAVTRNKIKRQIKNIIDQNVNLTKPIDYILIVKSEFLTLDFETKTNLITKIFLDEGDFYE